MLATGSLRWVGTLIERTSPVDGKRATRSVKVPPMSIPTCQPSFGICHAPREVSAALEHDTGHSGPWKRGDAQVWAGVKRATSWCESPG